MKKFIYAIRLIAVRGIVMRIAADTARVARDATDVSEAFQFAKYAGYAAVKHAAQPDVVKSEIVNSAGSLSSCAASAAIAAEWAAKANKSAYSPAMTLANGDVVRSFASEASLTAENAALTAKEAAHSVSAVCKYTCTTVVEYINSTSDSTVKSAIERAHAVESAAARVSALAAKNATDAKRAAARAAALAEYAARIDS